MKLTVVLVMLSLFTPYNCLAAQNEESKPLVTISGADSKVRKPSYERIATADKWTEAWARHLGTSKEDAYRSLMEIDFERCEVVAIFRGDRTNVRGIKILPLFTDHDYLILRIEDVDYQTNGADNNKPRDKPYAFVVIPKTSKEIILEEDVQHYKGEPPEWKEIIRIDAKGVKRDVGFRQVPGPVKPDNDN